MNDNVLTNSLKIKVCGMKYSDNISDIALLLPDYMGFIFTKDSARFLQTTIPEIPEMVKKTGVFLNQEIEEVCNKVSGYDLKAIQLHGTESAAYCKNLVKSLSEEIEIIKVFSVDDSFDFEQLKPYEDCCDYFLFDTKGKLAGGNGQIFNWEILRKYASKKPFFLSGGIGLEQLESISNILETDLPIYGIDINSKFEIKPGFKNIDLVKRFISELN